MKVGDTFRNKVHKYHVITILDKEPYTQIVLKYYGRWKQYWHYEVRSLFARISIAKKIHTTDIKEALARISVERTSAPINSFTPRTIAELPSTVIFARG